MLADERPLAIDKTLGAWTDDESWLKLVSDLRHFPGHVRYLELCAGLGTLGIVLEHLLGPGKADCVGHFEKDSRLRTEDQHRPCDHFGKDGDILRLSQSDMEALPACHILAAGPPCPPWSALGCRDSFSDMRAAVFWRVIDIVLMQAQLGHMLFFVLENVKGITDKASGSSRSPADEIMSALTVGLGHDWTVELIHLNTVDFGLPQRRPRVYFVGRRLSRYPLGKPPAVTVFKNAVALGTLLDTTDNVGHAYTPMQQANIRDFKTAFRSFMINAGHAGKYAVVDASRSPSGRTAWRGVKPTPCLCECLTASGPQLHVFALGEGMGSPASVFGRRSLSLDRPLRTHERAVLQGFSRQLGRKFDEKIGKMAFGNAMSVPVLGCVVGRELTALLRGNGRDTLASILSKAANPEPDMHCWHPGNPELDMELHDTSAAEDPDCKTGMQRTFPACSLHHCPSGLA